MVDIKKLVGAILCILIAASAFVAVAGIWGGLDGDDVVQCILTFGVVAAASGALGAATQAYFK